MILLLTLGCETAVPAPAVVAANCPSWEAPQAAGQLGRDLKEVSDLALRPGGYWAHNDSGDQPRIYALDAAGVRVATVDLGVPTVDWEDLAVLDQNGVRTLFVADTGDNDLARTEVAVVGVPEPAAVDGDVAATRRAYTYGDGRRYNAEALMADPRDGALWLVTKSDDGVSEVFVDRAPLDAGPRVWEHQGTLTFGGDALPGSPKVTSGDIAPDASFVGLRTYESAYAWPIAEGQSVIDALKGPPCVLPAHDEKQGEALAFGADGAFYTVSEGKKSTIWRAERR